jgi:hypothetical protein
MSINSRRSGGRYRRRGSTLRANREVTTCGVDGVDVGGVNSLDGVAVTAPHISNFNSFSGDRRRVLTQRGPGAAEG